MSASKNKLILQGTLFLIVFLLAFFGTRYVVSLTKGDSNEIQKQIDSINKKLPVVFEDFTSADSIAISENNRTKYSWTLLKVDGSTSKIYVDSLKFELKNQCQKYYDSNEEMAGFKEKNIIIDYFYYDKNGKYLFDFEVKQTEK